MAFEKILGIEKPQALQVLCRVSLGHVSNVPVRSRVLSISSSPRGGRNQTRVGLCQSGEQDGSVEVCHADLLTAESTSGKIAQPCRGLSRTRCGAWSTKTRSNCCGNDSVGTMHRRTSQLVTPELFRDIRPPENLARSSQTDVERIIKSTGFFRAKAKNVRGMATRLVEEFGGRCPARWRS